MALVAPDAGRVALLDYALSTPTPEAQSLRLYTNNFDPVVGSVTADFTEASGSGYAAKPLARATWGGAVTAAGVTSKSYAAQAFTFSGTITIVGYFIVGATSGTILWAERIYTGAGQAFNAADTLTVTPKIQMG